MSVYSYVLDILRPLTSSCVRGGKVAMAVALNPELPSKLLSNLIVADIAPSIGALSPEFAGYIQAMKMIEASEVKSRHEADVLLKPYEQVGVLRDVFVACDAESISRTQ